MHAKHQPGFGGFRTAFWIVALGFIAATASPFPAFSQDVPDGFSVETVATILNAATAMTIAPDGRVFVADQTGPLRIRKDGRLLTTPALDLSARLDTYWERGLIGLTLHPDFPRSPYLFVVYVAKAPYTHHVVSRFTIVGDTADPSSERILLEADDQANLGGGVPAGHQGGIIRVGPDGRIYVGLGDQTAGKPSQAIDTLLGKILRINQDGTIPEDNPFYNRTSGKNRSIWAIGIRNPFGLAFEPGTGRLFETDVGESSFEEVNIIVKGGNYGWPYAEGISTNSAFINPIHTYPPTIGRCIVSGLFYPDWAAGVSRRADASSNVKSNRAPAGNTPYGFPEKWRDRFFFADWANGWVKALNPANPADVITFAHGFNEPVALDAAPDGSLFVLNRGTIWRDGKKFQPNSSSLARVRFVGTNATLAVSPQFEPIPATLAETHLFSSRAPQQPIAGFTAFEINLPPWQPGVHGRRWISLPTGQPIHFAPDGSWLFPDGTIVIQHYEMAEGPQAGKPLETQVLWFTGPRRARAGAYRWNAAASDARLVEDSEVIPLPGQPKRNWFSPGAEQALNLDTVVTGFLLPMNFRQLNRDITDARTGRSVNQLVTWNARGWFEPALRPDAVESMPRLTRLDNKDASIATRVRSYLDVNCSTCHRPGGLSRGLFDARFSTPLGEQGLINGALISGDLGIAGAHLITPGDPAKSIMLQRVRRNDSFRMPQVNVNEEQQPIVPLLEQWIRELPADEQATR